jgi:hypothetical protein
MNMCHLWGPQWLDLRSLFFWDEFQFRRWLVLDFWDSMVTACSRIKMHTVFIGHPTLEDESPMMSWKVGHPSHSDSAPYHSRTNIFNWYAVRAKKPTRYHLISYIITTWWPFKHVRQVSVVVSYIAEMMYGKRRSRKDVISFRVIFL